MKNISIAMDDTKARIIEALAVLRGTTAGELIAQNGVDSLLNQATQEQIQTSLLAGTVGDDVKALVDWSSLWHGVRRELDAGRCPASVVEAMEVRAQAVKDAAVAQAIKADAVVA